MRFDWFEGPGWLGEGLADCEAGLAAGPDGPGA